VTTTIVPGSGDHHRVRAVGRVLLAGDEERRGDEISHPHTLTQKAADKKEGPTNPWALIRRAV
jgi:hypothetical protein